MKKKILIIDDDPSILDILKIVFERAGYEVRMESDGQHILDNEFEIPDIILLDRFLSGIDGLDICRHLKSNIFSKNIPVIMVSASPDIETTAREAGADRFIEKPFEIAEILKCIDDTLLNRQVDLEVH